MKPVVTWIVLANAKTAHIVQNLGPGKGIVATGEAILHAEDPVEYADTPGATRSGVGAPQSGGERDQPKRLAEQGFAQAIAAYLEAARAASKFDRIILAASPHLLGLLRDNLSESLKSVVLAELDRDLTHHTLEELPDRLAHVIAA